MVKIVKLLTNYKLYITFNNMKKHKKTKKVISIKKKISIGSIIKKVSKILFS